MSIAADPVAAIEFYRATGEFGFLSNLYPATVTIDGSTFLTAEHAYQYAKPSDPAVANWIVAAPKPHLVAAAAHALFVFDVRSDWATYKLERMRQVLRAKFTQHPDLRDRLLRTAPRDLHETSAMDAFWGTGKTGRGKNMLGVMLMQLRAELEPRDA